jgi:hypothetical protein
MLRALTSSVCSVFSADAQLVSRTAHKQTSCSIQMSQNAAESRLQAICPSSLVVVLLIYKIKDERPADAEHELRIRSCAFCQSSSKTRSRSRSSSRRCSTRNFLYESHKVLAKARQALNKFNSHPRLKQEHVRTPRHVGIV